MGSPDLYDEIASLYHLIYADWEGSIRRQAAALQGVLQEELGPGPWSVLDVSCGIGTQSLGLAGLGHEVTAADVSKASVRRAMQEARRRGLAIDFSVGDMRTCHERYDRRFDVVLSGDNAVPHLLTDADLLSAFRSFLACTRPGGVCLITVRDYEQESRDPTQFRPFGVRDTDTGRCLVFQTWDFDGDHYDLGQYFLQEREGRAPRVTVGRSRYYAVGIAKLIALLEEAGFHAPRRIDGRFFQPILLGRRPEA